MSTTEKQVQVPLSTMTKVMDLVKGTNAVLIKSAAERKAYDAFKAGIPATLDKMIETGRLAPSKRAKVAEAMAKDPSLALKYLQQLSEQTHSVAPMGQPTKTAERTKSTADELFERHVLGG